MFAKLDGLLIVMGYGVEVGEYMVEVNGAATEQTKPLRLRELGYGSVAVEQ